MPVFPSEAWMRDFAQHVANHPNAADVATVLDGVYRFVVEPAGPLSERHVYDLAIRPSGAGPLVELLAPGGHEPPRLSLTADYQRWRQLIRGELDVGLAVLLRRLRVSGELRSVAASLSTTEPLVDALHSVETEWVG